MNYRVSVIISSLAHMALLFLLSQSLAWSKKIHHHRVPLEAHLVVKKQKKQDLLPKKPKMQSPPAEDKAIKEMKTADDKPKKPKESLIPIAKEKVKTPKKNKDYTEALSSLSQSFANELALAPELPPEGEFVQDSSYFDQVYSLIKESFIIPPHLNGPSGHKLKAVVRIFLASDGRLNKLDLITPSGDPHFDKAVTEGARRVLNFGPVPIYLQDALREQGLLVELCPFTCGSDGE